MRIAYAGTAKISADILDAVRRERDVDLVISQPDRPAGRGRRNSSPPLARYAHQHDLDLAQPERLHDPEMLEELGRRGIDTIVVVAFGQMVREPILSDFLVLNVHASLLPEYRGAAPVERAIMDGRSSTGVSIMQLEAGLDTGPVARMVEFPIPAAATAGDIYEEIHREGAAALLAVLAQAERGEISFQEQDHGRATYAHKIAAGDRLLDPGKNARTVHDHVRALSPHIGARISLDGSPVTIWRTVPPDPNARHGVQAGALRAESGRLHLACADAWLEILELQPHGRKRMTAEAWLAGVRGQVGSAAALDAP